MKRPVATSEMVVRVRAFFHARRPAGGTPASCTEEEDAMTRTLHPLQNSVERVTLRSVTTNAIEAHGLVKRYGEKRALDGVDLAVARGAVCALLGPNGA